MILKTLSLKNFKQYGQLELEFHEGLVGIVGRNGAGKSSIFEAILLCLFGSNNTDKEFYKSAWAGAKEEVLLRMAFELNQKHYTVVRNFRGKAMTHHAQLFDQEDELIATSASAVNQKVTELLGMDKEAFTRSVFSGQKELGAISNTRGEERKKMVRKMIGLDNLDRIQDIIRKDRNDTRKYIQFQEEALMDAEEVKAIEQEIKTTKKDLAKAEKAISSQQKKLEKIQKSFEETRQNFNEQIEKQKEYQNIEAQLIKYSQSIENFEEQTESIQQSISKLKLLKAELKSVSSQMKAFEQKEKTLQQLEKEKNKYEERQTLILKKNNFEEKIAEFKSDAELLKKELEQLPILRKQQKEIQQALDQLELKKQALNDAQLQTQNDLGAIAGRIADRQDEIQNIQNLGKDANCPTCFQPLAKVYESTLTKLQKELNQYESTEKAKLENQNKTLENNLLNINNQLQDQKLVEREHLTKVEKLQDKLEQLEGLTERYQNGQKHCEELGKTIEAFGDIQFDPKQYESIYQELNENRKAYITYQTNLEKVTTITKLEIDLKNLKERISKGKKVIKEKTKERNQLKFSAEKFDKARAKQEETEDQRNEVQQLLSELEKEQLSLQQDLKSNQKELDQQAKALEAIGAKKTEFFELEELDGLFKAFKTYILEKVRPTISGEASQLFERITNGRYEGIEVDDNFEFHIYENGVAYPITRFSGGEIDLANFCLRIGISRAIAELSGRGSNLGFLGFDEVFGSQDEDRRFGILHALEHLKEQYRQIYIISHINSVKEHFPSILQIQKTHQGSMAHWQ